MASRPVFTAPGDPSHLVEEVQIQFAWNPGFAPIQKKKNIAAMHEAAERQGLTPLLEVSTKSEEKLGQRLSAFNLMIETTEVGKISIESAYQGSKVFKSGGPYKDIYEKDSRSAKKDERLQTSGHLVAFNFFGQEWSINNKTAFYNWLYLSALYQQSQESQERKDDLRRLSEYKGFTDIEFNPEKSINCQARSCALLVSLLKLNKLEDALRSQSDFIEMVASISFKQRQRELF